MSSTVTVIDYGSGNVLSVCRALEVAGASVKLVDSPDVVQNAERVVLPGVGSFGACMTLLRKTGFVEPLREFAASERPLLGICVGEQVLFERGLEFGEHEGLGLIKGQVVMLDTEKSDGSLRKIPHIGWNALNGGNWESTLLSSTKPGSEVYFTHSFHAQPEDASVVIAHAGHDGLKLTAAVQSGAICGTQFHPEKSGQVGLNILETWLAM